MKKFLMFVKNVNNKSDNTLYIALSILLLFLVSIGMIVTGNTILDAPAADSHILLYVLFFMLISLFNIIFAAAIIAVIYILNIIRMWFVNNLLQAFKEALKEDYHVEASDNNKVKFQ
jgi:hypothetical protein